MKRYLLLFVFSAVAAFAQYGNTGSCSAHNVNTGITFVSCGSDPGLELMEVDELSTSEAVFKYQVIATDLASKPSVCFGNAEPYDTTTNTFPDPENLPAHDALSWVYVCRPVTVVSDWNPQTGAVQVLSQVRFSISHARGVPEALRLPIVMLTNNENGQSSIFTYLTAPDHPATGKSSLEVIQVTSLGVYPGSGMPRYEATGLNFRGAAAPDVQLLTAQFVTLDTHGLIQFRSSAASTQAITSNSQYALFWLPIQQQPQVIDSTPTMAIFQTVPLGGQTALGGPESGFNLTPPVIRGYMLDGQLHLGSPFNFQP